MKRMTSLLLAFLLAAPSLALADVQGDLNLGVRTTHFASGSDSAKYDEYADMGNGLFGSASLLADGGGFYLGAVVSNPALDDQSYELSGGRFGQFKGRFYYDELTHQLSRHAVSPLGGVGGNQLERTTPLAAEGTWTSYDYQLEKQVYGAELTVANRSPFYVKAAVEQQKKDGITPWGLNNYFEVPMPVDYTTDNFTLEGGYRSRLTTLVLTSGFSTFENGNDVLNISTNGGVADQYSTPADNYSYNVGARLTQRLPLESLLVLNASHSRHVSEVSFEQYNSSITSPTADRDYDGDVRYLRAGAALTTPWTSAFDTRVYYSFVDRDNKSEELTSVTGGVRTNHLFEYDKHQAGVEANYRLTKADKLTGGYEYTTVDRNREDAVQTQDNLVFGQWKNTALDWLTAKLRLEYLDRNSNSDYSAATLSGSGLIHQYFTPFDYATKERYKAKLGFEFYPAEALELGLSYALVVDDYDATQLGIQRDDRHEIYVDATAHLPAHVVLNTYAGYEVTTSDFDSRRFTTTPDPNGPDDVNNYTWNQKTTYDFFVVGGTLTVPVGDKVTLVFSADHQMIDGSIDYTLLSSGVTPAASLADVENADDYYKTELGVKGIYAITKAFAVTLGYRYEKSNLDEWKYLNYDYTPTATTFLSGAGMDSDYEAHLVYLMTSYKF